MVVTTIKGEESEILTFPIIKRSLSSNLIVLFTSETIGFVLQSNDAYNFGYYSRDWKKSSDNGQWITFNGEITLKNV